MIKIPRSRWTRAEKALLLAPLLAGLGIGVLSSGPELARLAFGAPRRLNVGAGLKLRSMALSQDGRMLAAATEGSYSDPAAGTIYLWDAQTLQPLKPILPTSGLAWGKRCDIKSTSLAFSPNGRHLLFDRFDGLTCLDLKSRIPVWKSGSRAESAQFSPDGQQILTNLGGEILDAQTGKTLIRGQIPTEELSPIRWLQNGWCVASFDTLNGIHSMGEDCPRDHAEIQLHRPNGVKLWKIGGTFTRSFQISPDEKWLVSCGDVQSLTNHHNGKMPKRYYACCYALPKGQLRWKVEVPHSQAYYAPAFDAPAFSRDGKLLALHAPGKIVLLQARTGRILKQLPIRLYRDKTIPSLPDSLAFAPNGKRIYLRTESSILVLDW
jgi:hypothetical protein